MIVISNQQAEDLFANLSPEAIEAIKAASEKAKQYNSPYVDPEHIFLALLEMMGGFELIEGAGADAKKIQDELYSKLPRGEFTGQAEYSSKSKQLFEEARRLAQQIKSEFVEPYHLVVAITKHPDWLAAQVLKNNKLDLKKLEVARGKAAAKQNQELAKGEATQGERDRATATAGKSMIETYTTDLTAKAKQGRLDPVIERDKEVERVMEILTRRTKNNPVLIGEAGVGKTAIAEGLAQKIASGAAPGPLKDKRILVLDLSLLVAGAKHRGEFEDRLQKLIAEIKAAAGTIILFIDEVHTVIGAGGGEGSIDASNILKPSLARGELQTIGATTIKEYRQYIEKDAAFERRFQKVLIEEPTAEQAIKMLEGVKGKYEEHHKVKIQKPALEAAVRLSQRYISDRFLPDKAIDVIDEAAAKVVLKNISPKEVTEDLVKEVVSVWSGIPVARLTQDETKVLLKLEELIHQRLVDQEPAVKAVCEAIRRNRAGLKNPKRPVGSFIFMGPTGVGKTQLAKTLAEVMFGTEDKMIRIDMSEYMEKNATARMIGAPPGYVGYEEGGQLTEAVRKNPYSVLLLDEIEKANPDVFNIFLQILDDGRLTDGKGRTVDFKNTIIICTSNIGTQLIKSTNVNDPSLQKQILGELLRSFRPEFINRFDDLIVFRGLTAQDMQQIIEVIVKEMTKLLGEQKITLTISPTAKSKLVELGYDPVFGARPLRRVLMRLVENPLSAAIIKGEVKAGQNVLIDLDQNQQFTFKPARNATHNVAGGPSSGGASAASPAGGLTPPSGLASPSTPPPVSAPLPEPVAPVMPPPPPNETPPPPEPPAPSAGGPASPAGTPPQTMAAGE